jgi:hypothetical protein
METVSMNALIFFQRAISKCQNKYHLMLNLLARTDDALYEAISCVYLLYLKSLSTNLWMPVLAGATLAQMPRKPSLT